MSYLKELIGLYGASGSVEVADGEEGAEQQHFTTVCVCVCVPETGAVIQSDKETTV